MKSLETYLGKEVKVIVDRPLGFTQNKEANLHYPINYGYLEKNHTKEIDGIDAYIIGVHKPLKEYIGEVIGVVEGENGIQGKLVVGSCDCFTSEEIMKEVSFREKRLKTNINVREDHLRWMHNRMSMIMNHVVSLSHQINCTIDYLGMNYATIDGFQQIQNYMIPVINYKNATIGFNLDYVFIETLMTGKQVAEWQKNYHGVFDFKIDEPAKGQHDRITNLKEAVTVYIPYTRYERNKVLIWLQEIFGIQ